ncbi:MAG: hypothetical protein H0V49_06015 [Nocardioidaceae bacterium]|nr:hypothetical protein [Nocardioidaceae bacterium]
MADLSDAQLRVVRRSQLYELGWTRHQVEHEIVHGRWQRVAAEVFALQNAPLTYQQRLWLGVLHAGQGSLLSHGTCCREAGLTGWEPTVIEVLTRKSNTVDHLDGFFFHETRREFRSWIQPTSSPQRLRLEFAALLAAERQLAEPRGGLIAATVQQRLTTAERLLAASFDVNKLRHGRQLRLALGDIAGGAQSFAEINISWLCRSHGLAEPDRQVVRLDRDGRRRYLDCAWRLPNGGLLILEVDGAFHLKTDNWWQDMKRERLLVISTGKVLRCSSIEARLDPDGVAQDLRAAGVPAAQAPLVRVGLAG